MGERGVTAIDEQVRTTTLHSPVPDSRWSLLIFVADPNTNTPMHLPMSVPRRIGRAFARSN
jgi:hypothetical protein